MAKINRSPATGAPWELSAEDWNSLFDQVQEAVGGGTVGDSATVRATGSVTYRALADRFADRLTPEDFEALGDGVADDTDAIQAALDSGATQISGRPGATYLVGYRGTKTIHGVANRYCLTLPSGVFLDLNGATLKLANGSNAAVVINSNAGTSDDSDLGFGNGTVDGNRVNQTAPATGEMPALYLHGVTRPRVVNVKAQNVRDYASRFLDIDDGYFDGLNCTGSDGDGWSFGVTGSPSGDDTVRSSHIDNVTASNCLGTYGSLQGNPAIFTVENTQVGKVLGVNCAGGLKIQDYCRDSTFGSLTFIGGATGTNNSGVKVQGNGAGLQPKRVSIGRVACSGTYGAGIYLHDTGPIQVGAYVGQGNATGGAYPDVWVDGSEASIGSIVSDAPLAAPVSLRAVMGVKPVNIGSILVIDFPGALAISAAANVIANIEYIAADVATVTTQTHVFQYNAGSASITIGNIRKGNVGLAYYKVEEPTTGEFTVFSEGASSYPTLAFSATTGNDAISLLNVGARIRFGPGTNAYFYSNGGGTGLITPAVIYSPGLQAQGATKLYLAGNVANDASAVGTQITNANQLTTAGAKLLVVDDGGATPAERFSVSHDGVLNLAGGPRVFSGTGAPEGVVAAVAGSVYLRTDGGASTTLYVKTTGSGNTGWTAK